MSAPTADEKVVLARAAEAGFFAFEFDRWLEGDVVSDGDEFWEKKLDEKASALLGHPVDLGVGDDVWTNKDDDKECPVWGAMSRFHQYGSKR